MWSDLDDADATATSDGGDDGDTDAGWRARQTSNLHHTVQKCLITNVVNQDDE